MKKQYTTLRDEPLKKGEVVKMLEIPQELFQRFPETQHVALKAEVGNVHLIQNFNEYGQIELEIHDEYYTPHTIWVDPSCVTRKLK